ncbi:VOC family protein [Streptomyces sp. 11x1]|uniref:VOC family protein n=1 Tax=Streptomyces sp. 11x1 TaxID=3038642 RepID=UPI00293100F9|nr:VOC family protein [Streptomyces sp. 11x1]WNZ13418.1 VOC family protein [Streptomyces sp. 11x1]
MTQPFEVGVVVRDLEVSERFYREVLGCVPVHRSHIPDTIGGPAGLGGPLSVVWLQVPSGGRIKLIRLQADADADADADAEARPCAAPLAARRGLSYVTFHFDDIVPVVAALSAAGARPLSSPVVVVARDRRISFWADPEGNVLELVDRRGGDQETRWTRPIVIREPLQ